VGLFRRKVVRYEIEARPDMEVWGEGYYQRTLKTLAELLADYRLINGMYEPHGPHPDIPVMIELRRNPDNLDDVKCMIDGLMVGHLNPEAAARLQDDLHEAEEKGLKAEVKGRMSGGVPPEGTWSVKIGWRSR
jgi:hypothetical protein